jgi:hypothetical protein
LHPCRGAFTAPESPGLKAGATIVGSLPGPFRRLSGPCRDRAVGYQVPAGTVPSAALSFFVTEITGRPPRWPRRSGGGATTGRSPITGRSPRQGRHNRSPAFQRGVGCARQPRHECRATIIKSLPGPFDRPCYHFSVTETTGLPPITGLPPCPTGVSPIVVTAGRAPITAERPGRGGTIVAPRFNAGWAARRRAASGRRAPPAQGTTAREPGPKDPANCPLAQNMPPPPRGGAFSPWG